MTHRENGVFVARPSQAVLQVILHHQGDPAFERRFFDKVDLGFDVDDCHIWTGALSDQGYGNFLVKNHTVRAHRVAWILRFGEPPAEKPFLDHINCLGRFCVNTDHLEPVTNQENGLRARRVGKINQRKVRDEQLFARKLRREKES